MVKIQFDETAIYKHLCGQGTEGAEVNTHIHDLIEKYFLLGNGIFSDFSDYTDHGLAHIFGLCETIKVVMGDGVYFSYISPKEWEILLKACILHDIGLMRSKNETQIRKNDIRDTHHTRSKEFITRYYRDLQLDQDQAKIISEIVEAHRISVDLNNVSEQEPIGTDRYHTRLLAAILRISDELNIIHRTSDLMTKLHVNDMEAELHHRLCQDTIGIMFDKDEIIITEKITFKEEKSEFLKRKLKIDEVFESVKGILLSKEIKILGIELRDRPAEKNMEIEREIKRLLLDDEMLLDEIVKKLDTDTDIINRVISGLKMVGILDEVNGKLKIASNINVFKKLAREFIEDKELKIEFIESKYCKNIIEKIYTNEINTTFGFSVSENKIMSELLLLSPKTLEWVLFDEYIANTDMGCNPDSKKSYFYSIVIAGFLTDIVWYKKLSTEQNIKKIQEMYASMGDCLPKYLEFIKRIHVNGESYQLTRNRKDSYQGSFTISRKSGNPSHDINRIIKTSLDMGDILHAQPIAFNLRSVKNGGVIIDKKAVNEDRYFLTLVPNKNNIGFGRKLFGYFEIVKDEPNNIYIKYIDYYSDNYIIDYLIFSLQIIKGQLQCSFELPYYADVEFIDIQNEIIQRIVKKKFENVILKIEREDKIIQICSRDDICIDEDLIRDGFLLNFIKIAKQLKQKNRIMLPKFINEDHETYLKGKEGTLLKVQDLVKLRELKSSKIATMRRLMLLDYESGIVDIKIPKLIDNEIKIEYSNKEELDIEKPITSVIYTPYDAIEVYSSFMNATDPKDFFNVFSRYLKCDDTQERKSALYMLVYPFEDMFWYDTRVVDFICIKYSGANYYYINGMYFLVKSTDYSKSLEYFVEAEKIMPESILILQTISWVYILLNRLEEAYIKLKKIEEIDAKSEGDFYLANFALYYLIKGEIDSALIYYQKALAKENWKQLVNASLKDIDDFISKGLIKKKDGEKFIKILKGLKNHSYKPNDLCPCGSGKKYKNCHNIL